MDKFVTAAALLFALDVVRNINRAWKKDYVQGPIVLWADVVIYAGMGLWAVLTLARG